MSANTANALKVLIESGGLRLSAHRDVAPEGSEPPFVTVTEGIAVVPAAVNARFDPLEAPVVIETAQVSLWQAWRDPATGDIVESAARPDDLIRLLDGAVLATSPTHSWGVKVRSSRRLLERDENIVQTAITVEVVRDG